MKISAALTLLALAGSSSVLASPFINHQLPVGTLDSNGLRLIQYSDDVPAKWMTEQQVEDLFRLGIKFMDITDHPDLDASENLRGWTPYIPSAPAYKTEVTPFIGNLTTKLMEANLKEFTSFRNRYYKSTFGADSAKWLYGQISDTIGSVDNISVRKFEHSWSQFSIIARFEGTNADLSNELVIVGAHQDSVNMWMPSFGRAPGADDDGSGTVTILEAFRVLVQGGFKPERPVEFHWYSGEEAGLLGSQAVASDYKQAGKKIVAMIQNDMTGYVGSNGEVMGIVHDHVDPKLTEFVTKLIESYADIPWKETKCGYGCSDHASWNKAGFPSAFAIESAFEDSNQYIHTSNDVIEHLSFDHMKEFSKLSVAFAIELSHSRS